MRLAIIIGSRIPVPAASHNESEVEASGPGPYLDAEGVGVLFTLAGRVRVWQARTVPPRFIANFLPLVGEPAEFIIESWRWHYNTLRPHGSVSCRPPAPDMFVPAFA